MRLRFGRRTGVFPKRFEFTNKTVVFAKAGRNNYMTVF